jgi:hypothetical protein
MLAGLVAITAPCAFVAPWAAVSIGFVAGILVVWAALFLERIVKVDDPVGAIAVHGVNGAWGVLALGLFADGTYGKGWNNSYWYKLPDGTLTWLAEKPEKLTEGWIEQGVTGLLYGNPTQFYAESIGVGANLVWVFGSAIIFFFIVEKIIGNRVSRETELQGLDIPEMGAAGYINEDPKTPEGHVLHRSPEPKPATKPVSSNGRFTVVVLGAEPATLTEAWGDLCRPKPTPPAKEFLIVYPNMTTLQGNRFCFRAGDPELIRTSMERLLQGHIRGKPVRATIER